MEEERPRDVGGSIRMEMQSEEQERRLTQRLREQEEVETQDEEKGGSTAVEGETPRRQRREDRTRKGAKRSGRKPKARKEGDSGQHGKRASSNGKTSKEKVTRRPNTIGRRQSEKSK